MHSFPCNTPQSGTFLPLVNLYQLLIITQGPQLTLGFTLGGVHPVGLDKCLTRIRHYSIKQNRFTSLMIIPALPIHPSLPSSGNH